VWTLRDRTRWSRGRGTLDRLPTARDGGWRLSRRDPWAAAQSSARDLLVAESDVMREVVAASSDGGRTTSRSSSSASRAPAASWSAAHPPVEPRRKRPLVTVRTGAAPREIFVDEIEGSSNSAFTRRTAARSWSRTSASCRAPRSAS
jgi:hypothetical protein